MRRRTTNHKPWFILGAIILFFLIFGGLLASFYTDWLWFGEVGYRSVFWTKLTSRIELGLIAGLLFFIIVFANIWLARKMAPTVVSQYTDNSLRSRMGRLARRGFILLTLAITLGLSVLVALEAGSHWLSYQVFSNATAFGETDPIFNRDIGFFVFKLGFLQYIYGWLFFTLIVAVIATAIIHYTDRAIEVLAGRPTFAPHVKSHLSLLFAAALFVKAWGYRLNSYELLYSPTGVVYGPGYTDVHARLIGYKILTIVAIIAGLLALVNIFLRGIKLPATALVILLGASVILGWVYPGFVQQAYVKPNELNRESAYIKNNINLTRQAYNLNKIEVRNFPELGNLTAAEIQNNSATINSIRLWDYRPLRSTYTQLQALWQNYDIPNVDIDRYRINGDIRQVMLAARELSTDTTQATSSWVNRRFQFTHGYGAVMSPVNTSTEQGLPEFFIKDMPPKSSVGINITTPQIYYGELTTDYVISNSDEKEFDYPSEGKPTYTSYSGTGGIPIGNYLQRLAFAWRFSDTNLILNNPITSQSRLMYRRQIMERVQTIFPFLIYDPDPYLVISGGKLYWMIDAYSVSNRYPYSTPFEISPRSGFNVNYFTDVNYIRNAAKIVIDAYNGNVNYYTADDSDPLVKTYSKIFPGVFKPMSSMPADIHEHIRYPELLFRTQSQMLLTYHMEDPQVFYNKSDRWDLPNEIVETSEVETPMEPYYVVMKLPGQDKEQFLMMRPFTPVTKSNMVAWMGAISDPENYGKILLYQFQKDQLIYGPAQIEAKINQDPVISPQISLWDQRGSQVSRGNMIVIPIGESILYVKPLYLQSRSSKIPELARVVVAYGDRVIMETTLNAALQKLFGGSAGTTRPATTGITTTPTTRPSAPSTAPAPTGDMRTLINRAASQFNEAQELQRRGDWAGYGEKLRQLQSTLRQLQQQSGGE
ncbi:MAG: UPF0182 family membrane protein [Armatimonadota bacterium]